MAGVRDHVELAAWRLSLELEERVAEIINRPAFRQHARLRDQLERSSSGSAPNIAEGFARYYPRENAPFVRIAKGSLSETIVHLGRAHARGLIDSDETAVLTSLARRARGATTRYLIYLEGASAPSRPRPTPHRNRPSTHSEPGDE